MHTLRAQGEEANGTTHDKHTGHSSSSVATVSAAAPGAAEGPSVSRGVKNACPSALEAATSVGSVETCEADVPDAEPVPNAAASLL